MRGKVNSSRSSDNMAGQVKIVYIMGYGRSGSTFLDVLLNNHREITSVGAVANFFDWDIKGKECACGYNFEECEFWKDIRRDYYQRAKYSDPLEDQRIQLYVESFSHLFKLIRNTFPAVIVEEYVHSVENLFRSISRRSGKSIIVDSSKSAWNYAGRAYAMAKFTSFDIRVIHLIRDGRGVMWSEMKQTGSPERVNSRLPRIMTAIRVSIGWTFANMVSLITARHKNIPVLTVRYEDLVTNPREELRAIGEFIDVDMDTVIQRIDSSAEFTVGHNVGGNRLRFQDGIKLRPDFKWLDKLPKFYKLFFWVFGWPMSRKFGYKFVW